MLIPYIVIKFLLFCFAPNGLSLPIRIRSSKPFFCGLLLSLGADFSDLIGPMVFLIGGSISTATLHGLLILGLSDTVRLGQVGALMGLRTEKDFLMGASRFKVLEIGMLLKLY